LILNASASPAHLFGRIAVHASLPLAGEDALRMARDLGECFGGQVVDERQSDVEPALAATGATLLVVAVPAPHAGAPPTRDANLLLRLGDVPLLFVPERVEGVTT
jgi:hypothetical protein